MLFLVEQLELFSFLLGSSSLHFLAVKKCHTFGGFFEVLAFHFLLIEDECLSMFFFIMLALYFFWIEEKEFPRKFFGSPAINLLGRGEHFLANLKFLGSSSCHLFGIKEL